MEIVQTAKSFNVSTLSLADALVALAQGQASQHEQDAAFDAARVTWGDLFVLCPPRAGACDSAAATTFLAPRTVRCRRRGRRGAPAR